MNKTKSLERELRTFLHEEVFRVSSMTGLLETEAILYKGFSSCAPVKKIKYYISKYKSRKPEHLTEQERQNIKKSATTNSWY
ncbi:MAG: hypothetical protein AABW80_05575 [Nanoarchaeota archaeon]